QASVGRESREGAALHLRDATAERPDPERPFMVLEQRGDVAVSEALRVHAVEDVEADAVEPHQPFLCAKPDESVVRLDDREYRVLWKALLGEPHIVHVLCDRLARIEGESTGAPERRDDDRRSRAIHEPQ